MGIQFSFMEIDPWVVCKTDGGRYCMEGIEDQPLSKRELDALLYRVLRMPAEEVAFMHLEFQEDKSKTKAYFGLNGTLLYTK